MSADWWNNPCRTTTDIPQQDAKPHDFQTWNMSNLISQVRITSHGASASKEDFAMELFSTPFDIVFKNDTLWLPILPKNYTEPISDSELKSKEPCDLLKEIYRDLQIYAVSIDAVYRSKLLTSDIREIFKSLKAELRLLLCEFNTFLIGVNISPSQDVTESIIPQNMRENLNITEQDNISYIVYKEYLNCLEYLSQTLTYLNSLQKRSNH